MRVLGEGERPLRRRAAVRANTSTPQKIPVPKRDFLAPARLIVIRSFDVNRPGTAVEEVRATTHTHAHAHAHACWQLTGGVAGGSLMQGTALVVPRERFLTRVAGVLRMGDKIEVRPGKRGLLFG